MTTSARVLLQPPGGWAEPAAPRIPPPPPAERGLVFRAVTQASRLFGRRQVPNVFPAFHVNARLFWPWLFFASRLMPFGRLPAKVREKLILRVAWHTRSRYEWAQHLGIALNVGVTDDEVLTMTRDPGEAADPLDALLMRACDQQCRDKLIDDATWAGLAERYSPRLLVEILVLVGHYEMVAGFLVNAGVEVEADAEAVLTAFHDRVAGRS